MSSWRGLEVGGREVVIAGSADRTLGAVTDLLQAGARVLLADAAPVTALTDLADRGLIRHLDRDPTTDELAGAALLVIAAADEDEDARLDRLGALAGVVVLRLDAGPGPSGRPGLRAGPGGGSGEVVLVGGGPGDPGLITVAGLAAIENADVVATDRLAPLALLERAPAGAEIVDVGKQPRGAYTPQEAINALLVDRARAGLRVVRLKGGDPFVFGRGGEEWQACAAAGVPVRIIPGVTSATAAPAAAGVPLTHRTLTQGFVVVSGHVGPDDPRSTLDWPGLARSGLTLVVLMGLENLGRIAAVLIAAGRDPATPVAVVADGTLPSMRLLRAPLAEVAGRARSAGLRPPVTVVVGAVAGFDPVEPTGVPANGRQD